MNKERAIALFLMKKQENLYVYSRFLERVKDYNLPLYMVGSSSKGNSTLLTNINTIIDLGYSYKHYTDIDPNFFLQCDYVIFTHEHGDHFNPHTFVKLIDNHPNIKFIMTSHMAHAIQNKQETHEIITDARINKLIETNRILNGDFKQILHTRQHLHDDDIQYVPHITSHGDITNVAVEIITPTDHIMYASDLDNFRPNFEKHTEGLPEPDSHHLFTLLLLEANYDEKLVEDALADNPQNFEALGNKRHISEQTTFPYVEKYLSDDGVFIPLHASKNYGTLIQDTK